MEVRCRDATLKAQWSLDCATKLGERSRLEAA